MGRHSKEARKAYRKRRKQSQIKKKKSILTGGNRVCNIAPSDPSHHQESSANLSRARSSATVTSSKSNSCDTSVSLLDESFSGISGIQTLSKTTKSTITQSSTRNNITKQKSTNKCEKKKLYAWNDPLIYRMKERQILLKRLKDIENPQNLKKRYVH